MVSFVDIYNRVIQFERVCFTTAEPKNGNHLKYLIDQSISTLVLCYNIVEIHLGGGTIGESTSTVVDVWQSAYKEDEN